MDGTDRVKRLKKRMNKMPCGSGGADELSESSFSLSEGCL